MCVCEYVCLCDLILKDFNEHVLAREITNNGVKKKYQEKKIFKRPLLQYGGELPTSTADRGLLYSVLVLLCLYINVFSIIIFVLLGVGSLG